MLNTEAPLEVLEVPDKSPSDKKDYKYITLANNLKVLLVSDNKIGDNDNQDNVTANMALHQQGNNKFSAVALLVDVGGFSQPIEYQGLAHFLEHMIFMGSEKYPEENALGKYLAKCGGSCNAHTTNEETVYYFDVPEKHLDTCMDYFAAQLRDPLLLKDSMSRECEAVDSEYQLLLNNDDVLFYHLGLSLAKRSYPHYNFTCGNLKSLKEDIGSEQELLDNLRAFYKRHYSAHRMFACIQSCLPIQQLEELAIKHFANITNNGLPGIDFYEFDYKEAFRKEFYEDIFFVKCIADVHQLHLSWVLPSTLKLYKCKPCNFLSALMGYQGKGSLCAYLRKRLWALSLTAGGEPFPFFTLFNLDITLTDLGMKNLDGVMAATFSYIKLYNKASDLKEIYQEIAVIKATDFRYAAEMSPTHNVQYLANSCKYYPPKDILSGSLIYFNFNEDEIQNLLDHVNEYPCNIMFMTQAFEDIVYDENEKWFGVEYTRREIPDKFLQFWHNCPLIAELHLPQPNPFIAHDFRIFWLENGGKSKFPLAPEKLKETEHFELWFRQDDTFLLPHAFIYFNIMSPWMRKSGRNLVICALYLDLVEHYLVEELYPAKEAGIGYHLYFSDKGIFLGVDGYNEKLYMVIEQLIKALISTKDRISEMELETFKKQYLHKTYNTLLKPENVNYDLNCYITKQKHWLLTENNKYISDIQLSEIQSFTKEFTQELYVQALMQGNLQQQTAFDVMSTIMTHLNCGEIKEKSLMEDRATEIPLGSHKLLCRNLNSQDCNSVITNFYQTGPYSARDECILSLILMIIEIPLYDTLRTQQQLSYYVGCSQRFIYGTMAYEISVSSQEMKHATHHVEECMEAFHKHVKTILKEISTEDFENFRSSLIKVKEMKDVKLYDELIRNWKEIVYEEYVFERRFKEIEILKALEKQDILKFWENNESNNLRKLSIQVMGSNETEESTVATSNISTEDFNNKLELEFIDADQDGTAIIDLMDFKENLYVYPVMKVQMCD